MVAAHAIFSVIKIITTEKKNCNFLYIITFLLVIRYQSRDHQDGGLLSFPMPFPPHIERLYHYRLLMSTSRLSLHGYLLSFPMLAPPYIGHQGRYPSSQQLMARLHEYLSTDVHPSKNT